MIYCTNDYLFLKILQRKKLFEKIIIMINNNIPMDIVGKTKFNLCLSNYLSKT